VLTNTDPNPSSFQPLDGYAYMITTGSGIEFTGVDYNTASPYIFAGNSFDQNFGLPAPSFDTFPNTSFTGIDITESGDADIFGSTTVGLGHVTFEALGSFAGIVALTFGDFPATELADNMGDNLSPTLQAGTITVEGSSATPEPSSFVLTVLGGLLVLAGAVLRQ
jgi:hypothetical protein